MSCCGGDGSNGESPEDRNIRLGTYVGERQVKLLMCGDSDCGKTCLILRFVNDSFNHNFITTVGIDFKIKNVILSTGESVKIQIWDTAGQERFRTITRSYFRGADGIILVYNIADRRSFDSIRVWVQQIEKDGSTDVSKALVGNKCDISDDQRVVSYEEGRALAAEYGVPFFETSAKDNINVTEMFTGMAVNTAGRREGGR